MADLQAQRRAEEAGLRTLQQLLRKPFNEEKISTNQQKQIRLEQRLLGPPGAKIVPSTSATPPSASSAASLSKEDAIQARSKLRSYCELFGRRLKGVRVRWLKMLGIQPSAPPASSGSTSSKKKQSAATAATDATSALVLDVPNESFLEIMETQPIAVVQAVNKDIEDFLDGALIPTNSFAMAKGIFDRGISAVNQIMAPVLDLPPEELLPPLTDALNALEPEERYHFEDSINYLIVKKGYTMQVSPLAFVGLTLGQLYGPEILRVSYSTKKRREAKRRAIQAAAAATTGKSAKPSSSLSFASNSGVTINTTPAMPPLKTELPDGLPSNVTRPTTPPPVPVSGPAPSPAPAPYAAPAVTLSSSSPYRTLEGTPSAPAE